ncbi:putative serine protease K12H4.7 [Liolophura sinensis]|uniref:putative serine protease K12H4.7 n=1 Tax=Liolophura sinensis TaxID=3198878 RepID=UPI00315919A7
MLKAPLHLSGAKLPEALTVEQRLDHFNDADTRTWKQRYWVNNTFSSDSGPVFLNIGGEGTANPIWMVDGQWMKYAAKYKAICFLLEHRYYGESHPTQDLSDDNIQHLSSEQALADLASFQVFASKKYSVSNDRPWILFGGSYPGSLSAWARLKYPHLFHGAVSSSAPLTALIDFTEYVDVVVNSLETMSAQGKECTANIAKATKMVESMVNSSQGRSKLKTVFKLCDDIVTDNDVSNLFSTLAGNFEDVVQYNRDNRAFEGAVGTNITITTLCDIMCNSSVADVLQRYAAVNSLIMETYEQKCVDVSYKKMISDLQRTDWNSSASEGGRQWTYQTCTEFGFFQSSDTGNPQPFGKHFTQDFFINQCTDIFGPKFNKEFLSAGIQATNMNYGGRLLNLTNIVYINGAVDPWHALGFTEGSQAIFIKGTAHCANMYPDSSDDPKQLVTARENISKLIGQWIQ